MTRFFVMAVVAAAGLAQAAAAEWWPFIVIRHTEAINGKPETFERLIDCHRRHRGACDEIAGIDPFDGCDFCREIVDFDKMS